MTTNEMIDYIYCDINVTTKCFQTYYKVKEKKGKEKMKEAKFKVGDKVIIKDGSKIKDYEGGWTKDMADYIGRTFTIYYVTCYHKHNDSYGYRMKEIDYIWDERGLEPADGTIIISKEGNKVTAKCNGFTGIAKCNPEDVFEYKTGTLLAIERLFADMDSIKEGDSVVVTDTGKCYTTYTRWITNNIKDKEMIARFRYDETPNKDNEYRVEKISEHGSWDDMLAFISGMDGCYLISMKGIKKYETGKRKGI